MFGREMKECKHHFEARYTEEESNLASRLSNVHIQNMEGFRQMLIIKKHVYDICTKCGKIVKDSSK